MLKNQRKINVFSISWVWPLSSVIKMLLTVINALSNTVLTPLSKLLPAVKLITALRFNYKWSDSDHLQ